MLTSESTFVEVRSISDEDRQKIMAFLQGAVYCWCKHHREEWFSLRTFSGGDNKDWRGTPLNVLYEHYINEGNSEEDSENSARLDAGAILKKIANDDKRVFETKMEDTHREYRWTGEERDA